MAWSIDRQRLALPLEGRRIWLLGLAGASLCVIIAIALGAAASGGEGLDPHLLQRNQAPSLAHPYGTDLLGRDMALRTLKGLALSLRVGLLAATASSLIAVILALAAATLGPAVDYIVGAMVDAVLALPHLVLLLLISFALGGGVTGVVIAVALSHWPRLARILRVEILQVLASDYVGVARGFGKSSWFIARHHLLPHLVPQYLVGLLLLLPHAILHEAGLTFLGFGLEPARPAIGILLAESMRYLSAGYWWLAVFPGVSLLIVVLAFDALGSGVKAAVDPRVAQE